MNSASKLAVSTLLRSDFLGGGLLPCGMSILFRSSQQLLCRTQMKHDETQQKLDSTGTRSIGGQHRLWPYSNNAWDAHVLLNEAPRHACVCVWHVLRTSSLLVEDHKSTPSLRETFTHTRTNLRFLYALPVALSCLLAYGTSQKPNLADNLICCCSLF